jgi:hypothetical protein
MDELPNAADGQQHNILLTRPGHLDPPIGTLARAFQAVLTRSRQDLLDNLRAA